LRATPGRIQLLEALSKEAAPLTIEEIGARADSSLNAVTLYRALEALAGEGIVVRSDLQHGHAHYELAAGRKHHHHVVCKNCGRVEDIEVTHAAQPEREALRRTKGFASIDAYALEFFGVCIQCS
jgi:Fur family ferric uptake transcriptional regulator